MAYLPNTSPRRNTGQGGLIVLLSGTLIINLGALGFLGFGDLLSPPATPPEQPAGEGVALIDTAPLTPSAVPDEINEGDPRGPVTGPPAEPAQETTPPSAQTQAGTPEVVPPAAPPVAVSEEPAPTQTPAESPIEFFGIGLD